MWTVSTAFAHRHRRLSQFFCAHVYQLEKGKTCHAGTMAGPVGAVSSEGPEPPGIGLLLSMGQRDLSLQALDKHRGFPSPLIVAPLPRRSVSVLPPHLVAPETVEWHGLCKTLCHR